MKPSSLLALLFLVLVLEIPEECVSQCPQVLPLEQELKTAHVSRVINGRVSSNATSVYHVSLTSPPLGGKGARYLRRCTGTLVASSWVLTAAHCNISSSWSLTTHSSLPTTKIISVHNHPNYTSDLTRRFDISLLHLSVHPPLPSYPSLNASPQLPTAAAFLRVSGFGTTSSGSNSTRALNPLHEVDLPALPFQACVSAYSATPNLGTVDASRQLCAGYLTGGCDACAGDSGGPLVQFSKKGDPVILAVVSAAAGCAKPGFPSINVRVQPFLGWIESMKVPFKTDTPRQVFITDKQLQEKQTTVPVMPTTPLPPAGAPVLTPPPLPVVQEEDVAEEQGNTSTKPTGPTALPSPIGLPQIVSPQPSPQQKPRPQEQQPQTDVVVEEEEKEKEKEEIVEKPGLPVVQSTPPKEGKAVEVMSNPEEAGVKNTRSVVMIGLIIGIGLLAAATVVVFIGIGYRRKQMAKNEIG